MDTETITDSKSERNVTEAVVADFKDKGEAKGHRIRRGFSGALTRR
jgi:hypothetical protein